MIIFSAPLQLSWFSSTWSVPDDLFGDGRASSGQYFRNAGPPPDSRDPPGTPLALRWDRVDPLKANPFLTWHSKRARGHGRSAEKKDQSRKKN